MSGPDFDMGAYEADLAHFLACERNESAATFGVIDNHPAFSDEGKSVVAMVDRLDGIEPPGVSDDARKVLEAILYACRLHPAAGLILTARVAFPQARSVRDLAALVRVGKTTAGNAIACLRQDNRFKSLFPVTKAVNSQRRRRLDIFTNSGEKL